MKNQNYRITKYNRMPLLALNLALLWKQKLLPSFNDAMNVVSELNQEISYIQDNNKKNFNRKLKSVSYFLTEKYKGINKNKPSNNNVGHLLSFSQIINLSINDNNKNLVYLIEYDYLNEKNVFNIVKYNNYICLMSSKYFQLINNYFKINIIE